MKNCSEDRFAAACCSAVAALGVAKAEPVKVGIAAEPYPPFTSPDASGKWVGWEIEFIDAVCAEAKLDCVITPVAWDGIIPALTTKKIDMIMGSMSITDERKKTIDFSDKYYNTPTAIIGAKDQKFGATPDGLKGKVIGVQVSTVHAAYAKKHFTERGRDQGIPDPGRGQPGSRRRPPRRGAGRFHRARRLPEVRSGQGMLRPEGHGRRGCRGARDRASAPASARKTPS